MKKLLFLASIWLCLATSTSAQVRLTEISPTNTGQITDEDGDRPDWIELRNGGTQVANFEGWGISDGSRDSRWILPEILVQPGERLLLFASGKNRGFVPAGPVDHWETPLYDDGIWKYTIPTAATAADWNTLDFDDANWSEGPGGFGYGDGDDATIVPDGTIAVYYRQKFTVIDPAVVAQAILSMDYDDGFVAYLNGVEIARSSNMTGTPTYNSLAIPDREATGLPPESYTIDLLTLIQHLQAGENVLAVAVHNTQANSSDFTARTWLHLGVASTDVFWGATPGWFNPGGQSSVLLHTDFKLNFSDRVSLYNPAGDLIDSVSLSILQPGHTLMRLNDDGAWCTTATPTPGSANGWDCASGYSTAPVFTPPAGAYGANQQVTISGTGVIRYTIDGSIPDENATVYNGAVPVNTTRMLRARSFETGKLPSDINTATYLINDPTTLPVVSVSIPPDQFGTVYDNHNAKTAVSVEYFDAAKQRQFSGDFSGYVVGNWSVDFPQKSLQFDVDEDYGSRDEIQYPLFAPDKPISSYRAFRIRNEDDDWVRARMRDRIVNELAAETHAARAAYQHVAAFINGNYWGHYVARERLDEYFVRDNYGANPDSVNMVKTYYNLNLGTTLDEAEKGDIGPFYNMTDFIANNDMTSVANFNQAGQLLDLQNFTDYMQTEIYVASTDWLQDYYNNIRLFKTKSNAPWKFLLWDVSYSSGNGSGCVGCDVLGSTLANSSRYGRMLNSLLDNGEYRRYFINRFADLMNTSFLPARAHALINASATTLEPEIERHNERWGTGSVGAWLQEVQFLRDFYTDRPFNQRQHIIDNFQLDQEVNITLQVNPPGAGTVQISTVIPTTLPWTGVYFHGNPVTITAIANPGFSFTNWTTNPNISNPAQPVFTADVAGNTTFTANFSGAAQELKVVVSEINYNAEPTRNSGDWFELRNESAISVDLSGFAVKDQDWFHRFDIPVGTTLPANGRLVIASDLSKFTTTYPTVNNVLPQQMPFELSDNNDVIQLIDREGAAAATAAYNDDNGWPELADGLGLTLERRDNSTLPALPESWFAGCVGGSPGVAFAPCQETPLLSEINYNAATSADAGDWIELHNPGATPFNLDGWTMRDENNDQPFVFPAGTTIAANGGYLVVVQDDSKFTAQFPDVLNKTGQMGFGLSGNSDLVRLYDASGRLYLVMQYRDNTPWPTSPDGAGYTLERRDFDKLVHVPEAWQAGCLGGSPGEAFDPSCISVSIAPIPLTAQNMVVWPNPAQDNCWIKMPGTEHTLVQLRDAFGRVVQQSTVQNGEGMLSTTNLPRGMYVVSAPETAFPAVKLMLH